MLLLELRFGMGRGWKETEGGDLLWGSGGSLSWVLFPGKYRLFLLSWNTQLSQGVLLVPGEFLGSQQPRLCSALGSCCPDSFSCWDPGSQRQKASHVPSLTPQKSLLRGLCGFNPPFGGSDPSPSVTRDLPSTAGARV